MELHMSTSAIRHPAEAERLGEGPYDQLYASRPDNILWGERPSRLVADFLNESGRGGRVLDVGCGDGANALAFEINGFDVLGFDVSQLALRGLRKRFARQFLQPRGVYVNENASEFADRASGARFDCVVSCGVYQCLEPKSRLRIQKKLFDLVNPNGRVLFSCLTNKIPLPQDHLTDSVELVDIGEIQELFNGWALIRADEGVISDSHYPAVGAHAHGIFWATAIRK
jgi:tellurite methyltransferase